MGEIAFRPATNPAKVESFEFHGTDTLVYSVVHQLKLLLKGSTWDAEMNLRIKLKSSTSFSHWMIFEPSLYIWC
jgi:hypothetical protein